MTEDNKNRIAMGITVILMAVWALLTIATCAGVWNHCPEKAVKVFAFLLMAFNGVAIWRIIASASKKYNSLNNKEKQGS